jgi:hypothetical protein
VLLFQEKKMGAVDWSTSPQAVQAGVPSGASLNERG